MALSKEKCSQIRDGLTADVLAALENEHGDIFVCDAGTGDKKVPIALRPLTEKEFDGFRFAIDRGGPQKALAAKKVFATSCVYPKADDLAEVLARYQGLPEGVTSDDAWKTFVGLKVDEAGKG